MTTFADATSEIIKPVRAASVAATAGQPVGLGEQYGLTTAEKLEDAVTESRLNTPAAVVNQRKQPRHSVSEINELSVDELRDRFLASSVDTRGPGERVLDMLDAGRNVIASTVFPGLEKRARERGERGSFGLGEVHTSDILEELGVKNHVARAIIGFVGDVAFDPLTYVGAPAKGLSLAASASKGSKSVYSFTKAARKEIIGDIEKVATGQQGASVFGPYLAKVAKEIGLDPSKPGAKEALSNHVLGKIERETLADAGRAAVQGKPVAALGATVGATIGTPLKKLGWEGDDYLGSALARDIERMDEVGDAAREALKARGEFISEPGIRIGVKPGEAATRIAHIPWTSASIMVPKMFKGNSQAQKMASIATMGRKGVLDLASINPDAAAMAAVAHNAVTNVGQVLTEREAMLAARAEYAAKIEAAKNAPPTPPPPPPGAAGGPVAPTGPTTPPTMPGSSGAAVPASPEEMAARLRLQSQKMVAQDGMTPAAVPEQTGQAVMPSEEAIAAKIEELRFDTPNMKDEDLREVAIRVLGGPDAAAVRTVDAVPTAPVAPALAASSGTTPTSVKFEDVPDRLPRQRPDEADDEYSYRLFANNGREVADNPDAATLRNLERATMFWDEQLGRQARKGADADLLRSLEVERDNLNIRLRSLWKEMEAAGIDRNEALDWSQAEIRNVINARKSRAAKAVNTTKLAPVKTRDQLVTEMHQTLSHIPVEKRNAAVGLLDAFMRTHNVPVTEYGKYIDRFQADDKGMLKWTLKQPWEVAADTRINTPEFREWFGESVVVDPDGKPLMVYHGTGSDDAFEVFTPHRPQESILVGDSPAKILNYYDYDYSANLDWRTVDPDAYHFGAVTDAESFGSSEKALEFRLRERAKLGDIAGDEIRSSGDLRHLRDLERMAGKKVKRVIENKPTGDGSWFAPNPGYGFISNKDGAVKSVYPVYLSIKNPKYVNAAEIEQAGRARYLQKYKDEGYDGVIFTNDPKDLTRGGWNGLGQIVAFYPEQIKSVFNRGTWDKNDPRILFQSDGPENLAPIWYSKLRKTVEDSKQNAWGTPDQFLKWVKQQPGIKAEELRWSMVEMLAQRDGKITKQDVLTHLDANAIKLKEKMLDNSKAEALELEIQTLDRRYNELANEVDVAKDELHRRILDKYPVESPEYAAAYMEFTKVRRGEPPMRGDLIYAMGEEDPEVQVLVGQMREWARETSERVALYKQIQKAEEALASAKSSGKTRWAKQESYNTEGTTRRRELVMYFDEGVDPFTPSDKSHYGDIGQSGAVVWSRVGDAVEDAGGGLRRVLLIDEIQSNRHQMGAAKGYSPRQGSAERWNLMVEQKKVQERIDEIGQRVFAVWNSIESEQTALRNTDNVVNMVDGTPEFERYMAMSDVLRAPPREMVERLSKSKVDLGDKWLKAAKELDSLSVEEYFLLNKKTELSSLLHSLPGDAPFRDNWHEVMLKRMIRYASENGYDAVAWTTGEQQAKRWGLSRNVSRVRLETPTYRTALGDKGEHVLKAYDKSGREVIREAFGDAKDIRKYLNREQSDKLLKDSEVDGVSELTGVDLDMGGDFLKKLYNKLIPEAAVKAHKDDGVNLRQIHLRRPYGSTANTVVHGFTLTPEIRRNSMDRGYALWQKNRGAISFDDDGKAVIAAFQTADATTLPHELAHGFRRWLTKLNPAEHALIEKHYKVKPGAKWSRAQEEAYATDFELYLSKGVAPTEELRSVFEQFVEWIAKVYMDLVGTKLEGKLPKEMQEHFNRILGGMPEPEVALKGVGKKYVKLLGSREELLSRLESMTEDHRSATHWEEVVKRVDQREGIYDGVGGTTFSTTFSGPLPEEVRLALEGRFHLMKYVKANFGPLSNSGESSFKEMGADAWVEALEKMHGSRTSKALRAAQELTGQNPTLEFYSYLLKQWPTGKVIGGKVKLNRAGKMSRIGGKRTPPIAKEAVDLAKLQPDSVFTINGQEMFVSHDASGPVIHYSVGRSVPVSAMDKTEFAIDEGSLRKLNEADAAKMYEDLNPPDTSGGVGGEEGIPFSPNMLYQSDLPNQGGLFGQGNVGPSGEKQGGLFGDVSKPPESKPIDPLAQREGESLEDWKIRVKFKAAEDNTDMLFQDDGSTMFPHPDDPVAKLEEEYEKAMAEAKVRTDAYVMAAKANAEIARDIMSKLSPETYSQSPATLQAALTLNKEYDRAVVAARRAETDAGTIETFRKMLPDLAARSKETVLRELAPLGEDVANRVYELGLKDPEGVEALADAAQASMETAINVSQAHQGQFITWANSTDLGLRSYAASVLGTDNMAMAATVFARLSQIAKDWGTDDKSAFITTLDKMDEWSRRTFNVRGGYKFRAIANFNAHARGGTKVAQNHIQTEIEKGVSELLDLHGLKAHRDEAMPIMYAMMHKIVDPDQSKYNWFKKTKAGPTGLSPLAQKLDEAGKSGVFSKVFPQLEEMAAKTVERIRNLGDEAIERDIIDTLMSNHVPIVPSSEAKRLMLEQKQAFPEMGIGANRAAGTPDFALRRTTHQRYFKDELSPTGEWHWFYGFDEHLMDQRGMFYHSDGIAKTAAEIARERQIPENVAQAYIDSLEAQMRWKELVKVDPTMETKYPWKPTDAVELNDLYHNGRLGTLVGGSKDPEDLFDTNMAFVTGAREGSHQRAVANMKLAKFVEQNLLLAGDQSVLANASEVVGATRRMANGVEVTVLGKKPSSLGTPVAYFKLGDRRYRQIDPDVRQGFLGNAIPDTITRGIVPVELADQIEKAAVLARPENLWPIVKLADGLVGVWKKATLFSPSWTINDTIGNVFLAVSGGARPADMKRHAWNIGSLLKRIHRPEDAAKLIFRLQDGRSITGDHLLNVLKEYRIIDNTLPAEVAAKIAQDRPDILTKPSKYWDFLFGPNFKMNNFAQNWVRTQAFMSHLEQGHDLETAVDLTMRSMMDWGDYTRVESHVFRRILPFYSWLRNNLAYQVHLFATDPKWAASVPKLKTALEDMLAGDALVPEQDRPGWMREALAAQLTKDPNTRFGMMFANVLPPTDLYNFMLPFFGVEGAMKFAHAIGSAVTPAINIPLQISAGHEFFSGKSIGPDKYSADMSVGQFLTEQFRPVGEAVKVASAYGRSAGEGTARLAFGGKIQAMDDARLVSSLDRQDRNTESRLRGAISRANRVGDEYARVEATVRLLKLYERRKARGVDIPNWADARLAELQEQPV